MQTVFDLLERVPPNAILITGGIAALLALALAGLLVWRVYRYAAPRPLEENLTIVAASIATGVSAQGMWRFSSDVLGFNGPLRLLLFAFIEVAVITSAVRARRNMRENFSAGIDGAAVWVLTGLTAVLSTLDARSAAEAVFRLAAPLVAAWLWERGMAIEHHRITGRARIHWRITPERVLVWVGLAEATGRTAGEVDALRRRTRVALAAKRVRALRAAGAKPRKVAAAMARLERAYAAAAWHTGLARDPEQQRALAGEVGATYSAAALVDLPPTATWTGSSAPPETVQIAEDLRRWVDAETARRDPIEQARDPEFVAALASMAAAATGCHLVPVANGMAGSMTAWPVIDRDAEPVVAAPRPPGDAMLGAAPSGAGAAAAAPGPAGTDVIDPCTGVIDRFDLGASNENGPVNSEESPGEQTKVAIMRAHWLAEVAQGRRPRMVDLARVAGADQGMASRYRKRWANELEQLETAG
ncbi:hypothetical protein FHS43_000587 [Streptosporangium becharense]|uniref:DUF2637 domain-containing protein n=1 Tax=Streptosporangium becharense TaxID=1816182 RepID=A0A7W9INC6_9ACTN|nr:hypothetical protein [Streptosporangium becharense]MBB2909341.1 hypothetical protein [Streptosporangium becharense]MBB5823756.1 hypothetical protein [Streptosporangium becharense]